MEDMSVGQWSWYTRAEAELPNMPQRTQENGEYVKLVTMKALEAWSCRGLGELGSIAESQGIPGVTREWFVDQRGVLIMQGWTRAGVDALTVLEFARKVAKLYRPPAAPDNNDQPKTGVSARMLDTIMRKPESKGWSAQQWATHLDCSKSTVADTKAWDSLKVVKANSQLSKASPKSKRRRTKKPND